METGFLVSDVMTFKPVVVRPGTKLVDCAKIMAEHRIGTLIIEQNHNVLGVINDTDIVRNIISKGINPVDILVEKVMQTNLITISPEKDMIEALQLMKKSSIRTLPVLDKGKFVGLLTLKDILKIEPTLFEIIAERIDLREEDRKMNAVKAKEGICELCGNYVERTFKVKGSIVCKPCKRSM